MGEILRENEPNRFLAQLERDLRYGRIKGDYEVWYELLEELRPNRYQLQQESYLKNLEYRIYKGIT